MSSQDLLVFQSGNQFVLMDEITREVVTRSSSSAETIQAGIDLLAASGGEIALCRGEYPLDQPVRLASRISLRGKGRSSKLLVSRENKEGVGLYARDLDGVVIADLAVSGRGNPGAVSGIVLDGCGDCKVHDTFVAGFAEYGIWLRNGSFLCSVESCSLAGNGKANLYLEDLGKMGKDRGRAGEFIPVLLSNCMIYGGGKGVECKFSIVVNIVGCCVFQTRDTGFHIHSQSNSVVISSCRTFQVGKHAVLLEDSDEFNLSSNIFCWHIEDGVVVRNANWGTICANEVIDTGSYNSGVEDFTAAWETLPKGLLPYSAVVLENTYGYTVSGNTLFNWGVCPPMEYGVKEDASCVRNLILGNNTNYFAREDVLSLGRESTAKDNIGHGDRPYHIREGAMPPHYQTFQTELIGRFITDQL